jgi:hypothetical protein
MGVKIIRGISEQMTRIIENGNKINTEGKKWMIKEEERKQSE